MTLREGCGYFFVMPLRGESEFDLVLFFLFTSGPAHGAIAINLGRVDLDSLLDMTET